MKQDYFNYWGKCLKDKDSDIENFHLLAFHSLDVAAVVWCLFEPKKQLNRDISVLLEIEPKELQRLLTAIATLHDLGKFADAFQCLNDFSTYSDLGLQKMKPYNANEARHDKLGYVFFEYYFKKHIEDFISKGNQTNSVDRKLTKKIIEAILTPLIIPSLSHHGAPNKPTSQKLDFMTRHYVNEQNLRHAEEFIQTLTSFLPVEIPQHWLYKPKEELKQLEQNLKQISWHFAGICVIADWIGSKKEYFPLTSKNMPLKDYWQIALGNAKNALFDIGFFNSFTIKPFLSVQDSFDYIKTPTPLQQWAEKVELSQGGHLFILEDVTGAGKTEAALILAHRLMQQGEAEGFYFGLPSMATSNSMFARIQRHYLKMYFDNAKPSLVLAHSARDTQDSFLDIIGSQANTNFGEQLESNQAFCHHWFSDSKKKALLATVGVGTIDQALLTVLPQKYQTLRLVGLYKKVLILDEIHAFDSYTQELIKSLMIQHARQGGSVILLTATLTNALRAEFIQTWQQAIHSQNQHIPQETAFPLATIVNNEDSQSVVIATREQVCRNLPVRFLHSVKDCIELVVKKSKQGSVVWIRNTVNDAQEAHQALIDKGIEAVLFHSRFALLDRINIENEVLKKLGKDSTNDERKGFVVIATQVFQESLDVDTDEMITDICPIDHKIQRAGRLHRHLRNARSSPILYVHAPEWSEDPSENWLKAKFAGTEAVYGSPALMWLSMQVLRDLGGINMPVQARDLIEHVYQKNSLIPAALDTKNAIAHGKEIAKEHSADNILLEWRHGYSQKSSDCWHIKDDIIEISTRFSEQATLEIVLCTRKLNPRYHNLQLTPYAENTELNQRHIIALSCLKIAEKYLKDLTLVDDEKEKAAFIKRYPAAKYKPLWLFAEDKNFSYDGKTGFAKKSP